LYSNLRIHADTGAADILYYSKSVNGLFRAQASGGTWTLSQVAADGGRWLSTAVAPDGGLAIFWLGSNGLQTTQL
jgi:hypothetical protein